MELYDMDNYKTDYPYIFNRDIIEYDMKSANTSLAREFKLLPESKIKEIEAMGKEKRVITIGKIKRDDKDYHAKEKAAFALARKMFFEQNHLEASDVIAIKRDAIFVARHVKHEKVGEYINFRKKNQYTSFLNLKPLEIYFNRTNGLDVKGISDDVYEERHADYFGSIIYDIISRAESGNKSAVLQYIKIIFDDYKWLNLPTEFYREFNAMSGYRYLDGEVSNLEYRENKSELDIGYNFKILTNITKMLL